MSVAVKENYTKMGKSLLIFLQVYKSVTIVTAISKMFHSYLLMKKSVVVARK